MPIRTIAGSDVDHVAAVDRRPGEQQQADTDAHESGDERRRAARSA